MTDDRVRVTLEMLRGDEQEVVKEALSKMEMAKNLRATAESLEKAAKEIMAGLLERTGADTVMIEGKGSWVRKTHRSTSFSKKAAIGNLVQAGVSTDLVNRAFADATKVTEKKIVVFVEEKGVAKEIADKQRKELKSE